MTVIDARHQDLIESYVTRVLMPLCAPKKLPKDVTVPAINAGPLGAASVPTTILTTAATTCTPKSCPRDDTVPAIGTRPMCASGDMCNRPQGIYIAGESPHSCANCRKTIHCDLYCADALAEIEFALDPVLYSRQLGNFPPALESG